MFLSLGSAGQSQQCLRRPEFLIAHVAPILPQQVELAGLVGRLSPANQLNPGSNGTISSLTRQAAVPSACPQAWPITSDQGSKDPRALPLSSRITLISLAPERVLVHIPSSSHTCPDSTGSLTVSCLTQQQRVFLTLPTSRLAYA